MAVEAVAAAGQRKARVVRVAAGRQARRRRVVPELQIGVAVEAVRLLTQHQPAGQAVPASSSLRYQGDSNGTLR
jgi:hypothetical protein